MVRERLIVDRVVAGAEVPERLPAELRSDRGHPHGRLGGYGIYGYKTPLDFGCGALPIPQDQGSLNAADIFLAKLDSGGACLWSKAFGGFGNQAASGVAVDGTGHIVIVGFFGHELDFGLGPLIAEHDREPFIARFAPSALTHAGVFLPLQCPRSR